MPTDHTDDAIKTLDEKIKDIKFAMLTTVDLDGTLRARPMTTLESDFDGTLWFFASNSTSTAAEIRHDAQVNLSYADPDHQRYVSVSGVAQIVRDRHKMEEFWKPVYKAWFPRGLDDPDLILLRVRVEKAEYWDSPSGAVVQLVGFVKALATGQRAEVGENEKIDLRH
jgi:general stress protein 26